MIIVRFLAPLIAGLVFTSPCTADPTSLLAPDDPSLSSGWRPPASPTAGLKPFSPAETKDWIQLNKAVTPSGASMGGMKGMDMKGMEAQPTQNAAPPKDDSKKDMPGMSGMPGMGVKR